MVVVVSDWNVFSCYSLPSAIFATLQCIREIRRVCLRSLPSCNYDTRRQAQCTHHGKGRTEPRQEWISSRSKNSSLITATRRIRRGWSPGHTSGETNLLGQLLDLFLRTATQSSWATPSAM